jgi:hypothetical protein
MFGRDFLFFFGLQELYAVRAKNWHRKVEFICAQVIKDGFDYC